MVSAEHQIQRECLVLTAGVLQVSSVFKMSSMARLYKQAVISDLRYNYSSCGKITTNLTEVLY